MKSSHNIGGSLSSSNSPEILKPIQFRNKTLTVVPVEAENTHHLILKETESEKILAEHPNGYSCYSLAKRMVEGDWKRIEEQAKYIVDCGGYSDISLIAINHLV